MNKTYGLKVFLSEEVTVEAQHFAGRLLDYVNSNKQEVISALTTSFQEACNAVNKQSEEPLSGVEYVQFTLSRSDAMLKKDFYKVELFNKDLYLGGELCEIPISANWMYQEYFTYCNRIWEESKRYIGQIGKPELERIQLSELGTCQKIMRYLLKESFSQIIKTQEYKELPEAAAFHLSEYRGEFKVIYIKNSKIDQLRERVNEILQDLSERSPA